MVPVGRVALLSGMRRSGGTWSGRVQARGDVVAAVGVTVALGVSACIAPSGFETVGRTGVVSVDGDLAVVWDSCGDEDVAAVVMHGDRRGLDPDEENPIIGTWEMGERNREEQAFVPGAADDPPQLDPAKGYIVQALPEGGVENLPGVHFTLEDVAGLEPGEVLVGAEDGSFVGTWEDLTDC